MDNRVVRRAMQCLAALLLLNTVVLLFYGQFNLGIVIPAIVGAWLLASQLAWWQQALWRRNVWRLAWIAFGLWLLSLLLFCAVLIQQAQRQIPAQASAIVVLGAGLRGDRPSLLLQQRLDVAQLLAQRYPNIPLLVTGGQGLGEATTEAAAMAKYLQQQGIAPARLLLEDRSTSTDENLANSRPLLSAKGINPARDNILLVTSDFHLWRSEKTANKQGYAAPFMVAAPTPWSIRANAWLREHLAVMGAWVLGEY